MRYDVVVIGSGFGGAVMAARLGAHVVGELGGTVLLLEKGNDHSGRFDPESNGPPVGEHGNRFRNSLSPEYLADLTDVHTDISATVPSMNVLGGKGFGGGSNVYCGVSLRAPSSVFDRVVRSGGQPARAFPNAWTRASLDADYDEVERMLRVKQLSWTSERAHFSDLVSKRDYVFADACRRIGASAAPLKVASHDESNDGWWTSGQMLSGRQNLSQNYLAFAHGSGVEFRSGIEVDRIAPDGDGYIIAARDHRAQDPNALDGQAREVVIEARVVILAAGAIGSTSLLMRSRGAFPEDRRPRVREEGGRLGAGLSANGDYGVMGVVGPDYELAVEGHKGKPMCSFSPSFWREHGFLLIPFYAEPLFPALGQITSLLPPEEPSAVGRRTTRVDPSAKSWGSQYRDLLTQFGSRMLTMGCLALDEGEGEVVVDGVDAPAEVRWPVTDPLTETRWSTALETMRSLYTALDGEIFADNYRTEGTVNTSHPLGGCRMADSADEGVVDSVGEVFGNENLFVVDGAMVPAGLGVNPSLTIAAMAERIARSLVLGQGTASLRSRLAST